MSRIKFSSDVLSLARAIQNGVDLDGDGTSEGDASRMYYLGQSGGSYGIGFSVSMPLVRATAILDLPSQVWDTRMFNPSNRTLVGAELVMYAVSGELR